MLLGEIVKDLVSNNGRASTLADDLLPSHLNSGAGGEALPSLTPLRVFR